MTDRKYLENFPVDTLNFLKKLEKNNNREWFQANRDEYEEKFLKPAQAFVEEVGLHLIDINENFKAIPKIDKSIFRLHRDVRFSKDKSPYKTNLGLLFWEGEGKKMESSGLYFHVDSKKIFVATGMYMFTKDQLKQYRKMVAIEENAKELKSILKKIEKKGYQIGGVKYKKVPRGFDKEYKYADLLLHDGVYAFKEEDVKEFKSSDPVKYSVKVFKQLKPLHDWLMENVA